MSGRFIRSVVTIGIITTTFCRTGLAQDTEESEPQSTWKTRSSIFDTPGGVKEKLLDRGSKLDVSWTQFVQGLVDGDGDESAEYGGKVDIVLNLDMEKLGLWRGLSINIHQENIHGNDTNSQGDGTILPVNAALAFPGAGGKDYDTSILLRQVLTEKLTVSLGKFNMFDAAARTPLIGGGGIDTFQNLAFAAPISGVTPPYLVGGMLNLRLEQASVTLMVYDPRNAQTSDVWQNPFEDAVTTSLSVTIPVSIKDRSGFHSFRGVYSSEESVDLRDIPGFRLPDGLDNPIRTKDDYWFGSYALQQYLFQSEADPSKGWGLFFQAAISDGNPNPFEGHVFFGIAGHNLMKNRLNDRWGIGYFSYFYSDDLKDSLEGLGLFFEDEQGVELFYNLAITPWWRTRADLQIIDPAVRGNSKSVYLGISTQVFF